MNPGADRRLFELLREVLERPLDERDEFIEERCATGAVSADRLRRLLDRQGAIGGFLDHVAWDENETQPMEPEVGPGDRVDRFVLVESLGCGGMGQVFLAEQTEPVQRKVALKLIRGELRSETARLRFVAEQQALARLQHPNVAQLLEAGTTDSNRPFLAMEWVDGERLDDYCDSHGLDVEARLRIFADVCAAVHHAHQKQILHRDLKPSNVLVTEVDGVAAPKVIDFGIAKSLDRPLSADGLRTGDHVLGTPEYLSPEAFRGDVDTRSDVYSLGVILYRLLCGERPFRDDTDSLGELITRIERGDAPSPSTAVRRRDGEESIRCCGLTPRQLSRRLAGDLDAVVACAMHPDREQRYGSVADLAADVRRHLHHEPIAARPVGLGERWRLLARRHRAAFVAAALVLAALLVGAIGTTLGMVRAQHQAEAALRAQSEAEELSTFLSGLFDGADPGRAQGDELTARELLDQGVEELRQRFADQPLTRARLARTIGAIYTRLGYFDVARPLLEESVALAEAHHGAEHVETARAIHSLAVLETNAGQIETAEELFERALAVQEAAPATSPSELAQTRYHLGVIAFRGNRNEEAEEHFEQACDTWRDLAGQEESWARCLEAFGALRVEQGRLTEGEDLVFQSLQLRRRLLGTNHPHVATTLDTLCTVRLSAQRLEGAHEACAESVEIRRQVLGEEHLDTGGALGRLAIVERRLGHYEEAEHLLARALAIAESQEAHSKHASWLTWAAWTSWVRGRYDEAEARYRRALEIRTEVLALPPRMTAVPRLGIALCHWKRGALDEAEAELLAVEELVHRVYGAEGSTAGWVAWALGGVYRDRGTDDRANPDREDLRRAGEQYEHSLEIRRRLYPEGHEFRAINEADYAEYLELREREIRAQSEAGATP